MNNIVSHRSYIRQGSLAGLRVAVVLAFIFGIPFGSEKTRIAINGIGLRGQNHLYNLLQRSDVVIPAICDTDQGMINKS